MIMVLWVYVLSFIQFIKIKGPEKGSLVIFGQTFLNPVCSFHCVTSSIISSTVFPQYILVLHLAVLLLLS